METTFQTQILSQDDASDLQLQIIQSVKEFQTIQTEWEALEAEVNDNIFLTFAWLDEWWRVYGVDYRLYILVVRRKGNLVGVLPLMFETGTVGLRRLQFMGSGEVTPNHLDVLVKPADRTAVMHILTIHLYSIRSEWDVLELNKLVADSDFTQILKRYFGTHRFATELVVHSRCTYIQLPATYEDYLQTRSSRKRRSLRRERSKLLSDYPGTKFVIVEQPDQLEIVMKKLIELHQARWERKGYLGAFATQKFRQFHLSVAQRLLTNDHLKLFYLEIDSQIVAIEYCFQTDNVLYDYLPGFDECWAKYSPSTVLMTFILEQTISQKLHKIDFLEGDETYKSAWTTDTYDDLRLRIYAPTWRGFLSRLKNQAVSKTMEWGVRYVPIFIRRPLWQLYLKWKTAN